MTLFKAKQLLLKTASLYEHEKEMFSRIEIVNKINEIKYLAGQKKVPRLTLRKEIVHLENQLPKIFELEERLQKQKNHESAQITNLKKQIVQLKKRLEVIEDKELRKKVDKLSNLLGECLAQRRTSEDVSKIKEDKIKEEFSRLVPTAKFFPAKPLAGGMLPNLARVKLLQEKIGVLKQQLDVDKQLEQKDPEFLFQLEGKIKALEDKLNSYQTPEMLMVPSQSTGIQINVPEKLELSSEAPRHVMWFDKVPESAKKEEVEAEETKTDQALEAELPLPPPPRLTKLKKV